jgi:general secretion pathway protein D
MDSMSKRRLLMALAVVLAACSSVPPSLKLVAPPEPPDFLVVRKAEEGERKAPDLQTLQSATVASERPLVQKGLPQPPEAPSTTVAPGSAPTPPATASGDKILLNLESERLPAFIQIVFGNILKRSFTVAPQVAARTDLMTVRAATPLTREQVEDLARKVLLSYGVITADLGGGVLRFVPNDAQTGMLPEIQRGRSAPETPLAMRPVFQLIELSAVRNTDVSTWLKSIFGTRLTTVADDPSRNAILITGSPEDVRAAMQAIAVLDQPSLRGRASLRLNPSLMSVEELSRRLSELLTAQGYSVSTSATQAAPILLFPVSTLNALFVFAVDPRMLDYVSKWADELESRASGGSGPGYVSYQVKNTDAQGLAKVLQDLLSTPAGIQQGMQQGGAAAAAAALGARRVVVNPTTNTLIVAGAGIDRAQVLGLMRDLDRPARAVLIEVMVAEVRLTGGLTLGVEFAFQDTRSGGSIVGGTLGNLGIGDSGLVINFFNSAGQLRAKLNALATDNRARILSTPSIVARNGEQASVQVGDEVPIVTSNQTTGSSVSGGGGVGQVTPSTLQTIQYRNTGVILKVRPTIFSDDRIDLDVMQEVSAARQTSTGVNISPTFSQRKVETKLTLREGSTVMLAGLISSQDTRSESGVPLLKDIPVVGQLFKNDQRTSERTELVILITPYVISDDTDARAVTDAFRTRLEGWTGTSVSPLGQRDSASPPTPAAPGPALPSTPAPEGAPGSGGSPTPAAPKPASDAPTSDGDGAAKPSSPTAPSSGAEPTGAR